MSFSAQNNIDKTAFTALRTKEEMNNHGVTALLVGQPSKKDHQTGCLGGLKRKLSVFLRPDSELSYPSPPMSNPPSPLRHPQDTSLSSTTELRSRASSFVVASSSASMPGLANTLPATHHGMIYSRLDPSTGFPQYAPPHFQPALNLPGPVGYPALPPGSALAPIALPAGTAPAPRGDALRGGGRKSKAHVASACINCKRAHLSCDVGRPCARCVATGKQDTCVDVQHKKRGRPRLREEGEFKVEQMMANPGPSSVGAPVVGVAPARPVAATRSRRSDSFRSIRSHRSEGSLGGISISPTFSTFPGPPPARASFALPQPTTPGYGALHELPTAFMDLDLVLIKANKSLRHILADGQSIAGRPVSELLEFTRGQGFESLRMRLRDERERRDPTYMPPIMQSGQDPIENIPETEADSYTQGSDEHVLTCVQKQNLLPRHSFPVHVRLAKASVYFVVLTIPPARNIPESQQTRQPFQPQLIRNPAQQLPNPPYEPALSSRQQIRQSVSSGTFTPYQVMGGAYLPTPQPRSIGQPPVDTFASRHMPSDRSPPSQQKRQVSQQPSSPRPAFVPGLPSLLAPLPPPPPPPVSAMTHRHSLGERPYEVSRRSSFPQHHDRPVSSPAGAVQLPPLMGPSRRTSYTAGASERTAPGDPVGPSPATYKRQQQWDHHDEDGDASQLPRKRRRVGIDDVLRRD